MTESFSPRAGQAAGLAASGLEPSALARVPLPPGVDLDEVLSGEVLLGMDGLIAVSLLTDTPIRVLTGRAPASSSLSVSLRLGEFDTADDLGGTLAHAARALSHRALVVRWLGTGSRWRRARTTVPVYRVASDADKGRKNNPAGFNRAEYLRQVPPKSGDYEAVYGFRQDAESLNSQLEAAHYFHRLPAYGAPRQTLIMIGAVMAENSTSRYHHQRRQQQELAAA